MRLLMLGVALAALPAAALPAAALAATIQVAIGEYAFTPAQVAVRPGDTVVWTNKDQVPHSVTALGGGFDSGAILPGGSFRHRFPSPGRFAYRCAIHPEMQAAVVVSPPG